MKIAFSLLTRSLAYAVDEALHRIKKNNKHVSKTLFPPHPHMMQFKFSFFVALK